MISPAQIAQMQQHGPALAVAGDPVHARLGRTDDRATAVAAVAMENGSPPGAGSGKLRAPSGMPRSKSSKVEKKKVPLKSVHSWLRIDQSGDTAMIQADKTKLTHRLGVQGRDLRIMDPSLATTYPSAILCRDRALVVNLEHIKVIVTTSYVLVINPEDENVLPFITELKTKLAAPMAGLGGSYANLADAVAANKPTPLTQNKSSAKLESLAVLNMPFELRALEVCLDSISAYLNRLTSDLEAAAYPALDSLTGSVTSANLEHVRRIKSRLVRLTKRVETIREVLEGYLDDDQDMHNMNLTAKEHAAAAAEAAAAAKAADGSSGSGGGRHHHHHHHHHSHHHGSSRSGASSSSSSSHSSSSSVEEEEIAEVEMLLEAYFMHVDNTYNRLATLNEYIEDTEDLVNLKLDQHRNQLIGVDLVLTAFTAAMAMMTAVAGFFGMNLTWSGFQTELMVPVMLASVAGAFVFFVSAIAFLQYRRLLTF